RPPHPAPSRPPRRAEGRPPSFPVRAGARRGGVAPAPRARRTGRPRLLAIHRRDDRRPAGTRQHPLSTPDPPAPGRGGAPVSSHPPPRPPPAPPLEFRRSLSVLGHGIRHPFGSAAGHGARYRNRG